MQQDLQALQQNLHDEVHARIHDAIADLSDEMVRFSLDIHSHPELSMREHYAASRLREVLHREGFTLSDVADMPTAFVGTAGTGLSPRIAFLMEYDALPKVGHACGHNLIATGGLTAAIALKRALGADFPGTILAIGTPGEEEVGGKILELERGVFDGVDAALMFHPGTQTIPWRHATAAAPLKIKFYGKAAHAAGNPQAGRNALAAMIQFFVAVDALRQHIPETARLHGIITHGGAASNIVPDYTEAEFLVRALTQEGVTELVDRVRACAQGAALVTGTRADVEPDGPMYAERKNNHTLASRVANYLEELGIEVQEPVVRGGVGSSDIGNVSLVLPAIHPYLKIAPEDTPGHSLAFCAAAGSLDAQVSMLKMAESLAKAGADLLLDSSFLDAVHEEFRTSGPDFAN